MSTALSSTPFPGISVLLDERPEALARYREDGRPQRGDLVVRWQWRSAGLWVGGLLFCLLWDGFLVVWYGLTWRGFASGRAALGVTLLQVLFPAFHVWAGVKMAYGTLCELVNSTWIEVKDRAIVVRVGPLPPLSQPNRRLAVASVRDFAPSERITKSRRGQERRSIALVARLEGGEAITLVPDLPSMAHAQYLEHLLEDRLDLHADEPRA